MPPVNQLDYGNSGLPIQEALKDQAARFPDTKTRPEFILWNGMHLQTYDWLNVPKQGRIYAELLAVKSEVQQGFDIKCEDGWLELEQGEHIQVLRTWYDPHYEDFVEYPFHTPTGRICIWNVYKHHFPNGQIREIKWQGNCGFWIDRISDLERVYHCSHSLADPPDFESLVFRIKVTSR